MCRALARPAVVALAVALLGPAFAGTESFPTVRYRLHPGSTYQEGCFDPCDCPILEPTPLIGSFDLVYWPVAGPLDRWGIEDFNGLVPLLGKHITGSGVYTRAGELDGLQLELQIDGGPVESFDSGDLAPAGAEFPDLDIVVSMNDMFCWDVVLHIVASPDECDDPWLSVARDELSWSVTSNGSAYDAVCGDLLYLRDSGGDLAGSVDRCMADDHPATSLYYDLPPDPGHALWFLVRPDGCPYGPRPPEIDACP